MSRILGTALASIALAVWVGSLCIAEEPKVDTLLSGLHRPSGVAIRPGAAGQPYEVFVAESGAQRIVKVRSDRRSESDAVIRDFPASAADRDPTHGSPLSLLFLDRDHLVVGSGGSPPDVRLFDLADAAEALSADQNKQRIAVPLPEEVADAPSAACLSLSRTRPNDQVPDLLLVTVVGDPRIAGVWKVPIRAGTLSDMKRLAAKPETAGDSLSGGVAAGDQGFLVVGKKAAADQPQGSSLAFQNPMSGATIMRLVTQLRNIAGLAYSPKSQNLYALDMALSAPAEGGVFRMDDAGQAGRPACKAARIHSVATPTALAFGPDGALYITAWNNADGRDDQGVLLRITGDL